MSKAKPSAQGKKPFFTWPLALLLVVAATASGLITYYIQQPPAEPPNPTKRNPNVVPLRPEPLKDWHKKSQLTQEQNYLARKAFPYISKNQKPIKDCYFGYKGKARRPAKGAKVTVSFTIHNDGKVSGIGVFRDNLKIKPIVSCILKEMEKWKFPRHPFDKPVTLQYPFFFR